MQTINMKMLIGLVLFALLLLGGVMATLQNVSGSKGPKERRFVLRACLGTWILFASMIILLLVFEPPYRYIILAIYLVLFPMVIYRWSTMHQLIRHIDERDATAEKREAENSESTGI